MKILKKYLNEIYVCFLKEARIIFSDFGILLIASLAMLIYGFIYSYSYSPQILESVPIAVVDNDHSTYSRELSRNLSSSQGVIVQYNPTSLEEAKQLMIDSKVYGIAYIKRGFGEDVSTNKTAYFSVYTDASYFLAYKQFFIAINHVMLDMNKQIKNQRYMLAGQDSRKAEFMSQPVEVKEQFLYNRYQGYASFLMPAILILIIQQTILLSCGMVWGRVREQNRIKELYYYPNGRRYAASAIVLGRSLFYILNNFFLWFFVVSYIYYMFDFPANGNLWEIFALIVPYTLASSFMGMITSTFLKYRESSVLYIFFTSIPFLLLSGVSWPTEGMPPFLVAVSKIIPSTSAIDGFIRLQTMGANMNHIATSYITLWILAAVFFVVATICYRKRV